MTDWRHSGSARAPSGHTDTSVSSAETSAETRDRPGTSLALLYRGCQNRADAVWPGNWAKKVASLLRGRIYHDYRLRLLIQLCEGGMGRILFLLLRPVWRARYMTRTFIYSAAA